MIKMVIIKYSIPIINNEIFFKEVNYKVHVFTGDKSGAGTDANVFLTVYGEMGDTGRK